MNYDLNSDEVYFIQLLMNYNKMHEINLMTKQNKVYKNLRLKLLEGEFKNE